MDDGVERPIGSSVAGRGRAVVRLVLGVPTLAALLLIPAGRADWGWAWAYVGCLIGCVSLNVLVLRAVNPEVLRERMRAGQSTAQWDLVLGSLLGVFGVGVLPIAGLDERFAWTGDVGLAVHLVGLGVIVAGDALFLWAMAVNRFFSRRVSIQTARGHVTVDSGPYRYVRHPGYTGWMLMVVGTPIALGSLWSLVPALLAVGVMLVRTALEDRMLLEGLEGYRVYAGRVRYRLIPPVW